MGTIAHEAKAADANANKAVNNSKSIMTTGTKYDMHDVKLGDRTVNIELIGMDRINKKISEWENNGKSLLETYAGAYLFHQAWNPIVEQIVAKDRQAIKMAEEHNKEAAKKNEPPIPIPEGELSKLIKIYKNNTDEGVDATIKIMSEFKHPSTWKPNGDEEGMVTWALDQLIAYKAGKEDMDVKPELRKPKGYYPDAADFYMKLFREGQGVMSVITDKKTGDIMGAAFLITGETAIKNSDKVAGDTFTNKIKRMHAKPENTVYIAEMFISPELHGSARAGNMIRLMLRQGMQWANANELTHALSWTPGKKNDPSNPVLKLEKYVGFIDLHQKHSGVDVKKEEDGVTRFTDAPEAGWVQWGGGPMAIMPHLESF
jgi:hypothetical protein